jgi:hypothetical protein
MRDRLEIDRLFRELYHIRDGRIVYNTEFFAPR